MSDDRPLELSAAEARRLVPIVIDLIRDDLNPPDFQRNLRARVLVEEDVAKVLAVQTFIGRWFARSLAEVTNRETERMRSFLEANDASFVPDDIDDVWSAGRVLDELEKTILERWNPAD